MIDLSIKPADSKDGELHTFHDETGDARVHVHRVFPGIELVYNTVHMKTQSIESPVDGNFIEIQHCLEGRMEQHLGDEFFYLTPGDLSLVIRDKASAGFSFPLCHYHGITIIINVDIAPRCLSCFLDEVDVNPMAVAKRLCGDRNSFIIRKERYIEHIFSELYSVPNSYKRGYFKVKILELLLVLNGLDPSENKIVSAPLSPLQVKLAKDAAEYLAGRTDQDITVSEIAEKFHISKTHLQNTFRKVYGTSVSSYMRFLKMQTAALKLIQTEKSITEIALDLGYDNPSKFASKFRELMGELPSDYRKAHTVV